MRIIATQNQLACDGPPECFVNIHAIIACCLAALLAVGFVGQHSLAAQDPAPAMETAPDETAAENQARWEYFVPLTVPPATAAPSTPPPNQPQLLDLILGPSVFTFARFDLGDLRLFDKSGAAVPYALRILRAQSQRERLAADEFNRLETEQGAIEVSLDLKREDIQHNAIEIITSGQNFRRLAEVDGSDDGRTWRQLATGHLVRYEKGDQKIDLRLIEYSPSRFQFVRVRISPDPSPHDGRSVDKFRDEIHLLQRVEIPGEILTLDAEIGTREPTRSFRAPSSAWIIDLGGERVPCDRIEVDIADSEFARDIQIQYELPREPGAKVEFVDLALNETLWQRKAGEVKRPMVAQFSEVQTGRLKLIVTDHRNPPLSIRSIKFGAPIRQLVFTRPADESVGLGLYFGNSQAEPPNYDFARNLPLSLPAEPTRASYGSLEQNPNFVPPPKAFTERFPWLIYVVLSTVGVILAIVIISLSRTAIALHDSHPAPA